MGNMAQFFEMDGSTVKVRAGELCIAASTSHIATLRSSREIGSLGLAEFVALDHDREFASTTLDKVRVLVLEVDPALPASISRIKRIRDQHPELKIIAALAKTDVALVKMLVRQGVSDVAELPFVPEELAAQILEASSANPEKSDRLPLAPVFVAVRSIGGCGTTGMLTHLAAALAGHDTSGGGICLLDLDLQGGEVAPYVGLSTPVTLSALFEAGDRLDDELVNSATLLSSYGFSVVAAPDEMMPLDMVSPAQVTGVLNALRRKFSMVLVDLPADWTNWSLSIAAEAQAVLLVSDSSIASLRQARRRIDLLESVGVEREKIKLIANRMERRLFRTIGTDEIAQALNVPVVAVLDDEGGALRTAQDQGLLLSDTVGKNRYVRAIDDIARRIVAGAL